MTNGYTNGHEASSPDEAGGHESNISELRHGFPTTDDELQDTYYYWTEVIGIAGNSFGTKAELFWHRFGQSKATFRGRLPADLRRIGKAKKRSRRLKLRCWSACG